MHEAHVGMELVGGLGARLEICSCSGQYKIRRADEPIEVENHGRIASFGVCATGIRWRCGTADRPWKIEMTTTWWRHIDVWDRYRKIAESGAARRFVIFVFVFVIRPDFSGNTRAQQYRAAGYRCTAEETATRQRSDELGSRRGSLHSVSFLSTFLVACTNSLSLGMAHPRAAQRKTR